MHSTTDTSIRPQHLAPIIIGAVGLGFVLILLGSTPLQVVGAVILTATMAIPFLNDRWSKRETSDTGADPADRESTMSTRRNEPRARSARRPRGTNGVNRSTVHPESHRAER